MPYAVGGQKTVSRRHYRHDRLLWECSHRGPANIHRRPLEYDENAVGADKPSFYASKTAHITGIKVRQAVNVATVDKASSKNISGIWFSGPGPSRYYTPGLFLVSTTSSVDSDQHTASPQVPPFRGSLADQ